jgi:hypothetical protein
MSPREDNITIEDAKILFLNFAGREGQFNAAGDRNFCVLLDTAMADTLVANGWNVKQLNPREEGDEPQPYLPVSVGFGNYPPRIVMIGSQSGSRTELGEAQVELLDSVEVAHVDLMVRPYNWEVSGKKGKKAYLKSLYITIIEDALELKYAIPHSD